MKYLVAILLTFLPLGAFASTFDGNCYTLAGWNNNTIVNGSYTETTPLNNTENVFTNSDYFMYITQVSGSYYWVLNTTVQGNNTSNEYYADWGGTLPPDPPESLTWNTSTGVAPAGTVSLVSCGGGGSGTTTVATSTEALLGTIAFGQGIQIVILFLMVIGFLYNNMSKKKPWS